jgi:hypothetical protein
MFDDIEALMALKTANYRVNLIGILLLTLKMSVTPSSGGQKPVIDVFQRYLLMWNRHSAMASSCLATLGVG